MVNGEVFMHSERFSLLLIMLQKLAVRSDSGCTHDKLFTIDHNMIYIRIDEYRSYLAFKVKENQSANSRVENAILLCQTTFESSSSK